MVYTKTKRKHGDERRNQILEILRQSAEPVTGSELADKMSVSRQIIVQDISLLKAKEHPIIATSQGYMYLSEQKSNLKKRTVACRHNAEETRHELNLIVDCGVTAKNVTVEHPLYGEITVSLMVRNRLDVIRFMNKVEQTGASLLSSLTDGIHLHLLEAPSDSMLDEAVQALERAGYLL